jgi:hypothetical protein
MAAKNRVNKYFVNTFYFFTIYEGSSGLFKARRPSGQAPERREVRRVAPEKIFCVARTFSSAAALQLTTRLPSRKMDRSF